MNKHIRPTSALIFFAVATAATSCAQSQISPCDSLYATMIRMTQTKKPTLSHVRSCIRLVTQLYDHKCQNYDIDESWKIAQMIINSRDTRSVASYFDYLHDARGDADEGRALSFDILLHNYPETVLNTIANSPDSTRFVYANMLAFGFANHYYEDRKKSHEALSKYYYKRHPGVKPYAKKYAPVLKQVFDEIHWIDNRQLSRPPNQSLKLTAPADSELTTRKKK